MTPEAAGARTTVLIVDDDDDFRRGTARTLAGHGYICVEAAGSSRARAVLDSQPAVAAVLCDIRMPGQSGIDLLTEITNDFPDLAVVMTTGIDDPDLADVAFGLGAFGYLIKPFENNELLINLASALTRRRLEMAGRGHVRALEQTIARTKLLGRVLEGLADEPGASLEGDDEMIERLAHAVSTGQDDARQRIERMTRYAVVVARAIGFTALSLDDLRLAAALHDVGNIGVPDGVLLTPGPLSRDERAAMRRHPQIGYQLLAGSQSPVLRGAADIALHHHEWWDGSGYPHGLRGQDIPESARIAAVADVFDALTSERVFRAAIPFDDAVAVMEELRGRQFEPRLLDAFLGAIDEIASIYVAYPDRDEAQKRIRLLLVHDHDAATLELARQFASRSEVKVVATAGTVSEAVVATLAHQPDVILMGFVLPDGDGAQATGQIKALAPPTKVIMLADSTDDLSLVRAIAAGCSGFVRKDDSVDHLVEAVVAAWEGETIAPPRELAPLLRLLPPTNRGLGADLTRRELEILTVIASGLVNKQIAQQLGLSLNTVRNHARNILYKLQSHSKLEAVATAVREGIIDYPNEAASL